LCDALSEVHSRGIVHRDINPRNVMLGDDGEKERGRDGETERPSDGRLPSIPQSLNPSFFQAKLIDFGIAKFPQPPGAPPFTQHSVLSGTVAYASPEQCQSRSVDHRSDIYSLGVMLYEMLTGERPFKGRTPTEIAINHLQAEPRPPRQLNPEIPANVEKVILRALAKAPEDRQQSIQEFADDLRSAARQVVIPLTPEALPDVPSEEEIAAMNRLALVRRRRRRVAVAAAVVVLAMLAGAIWGRNWLASRALPLLAAVQTSATPMPSPEGAVASDLDSLELAAQLPGDSASGGGLAKTSLSSSASQQAQSSGTQPAASTSGNATPGNSAKSSSPSIVTPSANQASKSSQQVPPTPPSVAAASRTPQTTQAPVQAAPPPKQPEITQASKQAEDRKIRQRDADTSAKPAEDNSYHDIPTARRDRIAYNRDRDEGTLRRDSRDDADGNERETASRQEADQVGPKLIQWSGKVNGEREVLIDLPGTPGTLEIPRVYRNRVAVIEPPSASNRWRSVQLRVFGEGGVSFVVRWWPMNQFTKVAERR
ncbi:MAG TPA: protein kinase, partial [Blastocatellia bacterium]|nr:protein kinase [Blastocatellia bacterium]